MKETERATILIVDDAMMNRALLSDILCDDYDIIEAEDGEQAIAILQRRAADISLVVLDMVMPKVDGFGVLEAMNKNRWIQYIPVIAISAETSPEFIERAYNQGVTDFINRPFDALIVIRRVSNTVKLYAKQRQLMNMVANEIFEKERNGNLMVTILSHIVEFRNGESGLHVVNIGKLTDEEFEAMKQHTVIGHQMLSDVPFQDEPLIKISCEIARWHHERYDGRGYPDGLKGDEIPISAQVVSLADVYDALTSERVYKPAYSHETAIEMIMNGECGTFSPLLLECLLEAQDTIRQEMSKPGEVFDSYEELQSIAPAIQSAEALDVTEYALGQLEHERQKNHFATEISHHLQFDYDYALDILSVPNWAARRFDVPAQIPDPAHNEVVIKAIGDDVIQRFSEAIKSTTPQNPLIRMDCLFPYDDNVYECAIIAKSLWQLDDDSQITGFVGKIIRITGHEEWLESPFELSNGRGVTHIRNVTPAE